MALFDHEREKKQASNIFNLLNHPNFANPDFDLASTTFGQVLSTVSLPTSPWSSSRHRLCRFTHSHAALHQRN